jgi:hypothetical protein
MYIAQRLPPGYNLTERGDNMENVLTIAKDVDREALPCKCGAQDASFLLHQTEKGPVWSMRCDGCGEYFEAEAETREAALLLWNTAMKPRTGKASTRAQNKWIEKTYDRINLTVPKGEKDMIKAHAKKYDEGSVNAFINRAIKETMERDKGE